MGQREARRRAAPARLPWLAAALAGLVLTGAATAAAVAVSRPGAASGVAFWAPGGTTSASAAASPAAQPSASAVPSASTPAPAAGSAPAGSGGRAAAGRKKGVSAWDFPGASQALTDVRAAWYYTWAPDPGKISKPAGIEFVPMIWGAGSVDTATLNRARSQGTTLLGFNEPDFGSQANMTVTQALGLWPKLMSTGMRLGSPAPATHAPDAGGWLDQFMSGAAAKGYRVDFITLHWYGSDFSARATDQLKSYLDATYQRYHKPIWLTEYALIKFGTPTIYPTQAQQADFVRASTAMMERLPYVERYAWFALPVGTNANGTGLYRDGPTPTTVGTAYRAAGPTG
jgi:hypothetical protein